MTRTILITGAGSGFGLGTALGLARAGHDVIATTETWPQLQQLRERTLDEGVALTVVKCDITDAIDRARILAFSPDIVVLNAGVMESGAIVDIPLQRLRSSFEINLFAHVELVQGFAPRMVQRQSGKFVWLSSVAGIMTIPYSGAYCATKHAIEAIAWAMKAELAPFGIEVATIAPGLFKTGFNDSGAESMDQWFDASRALLPKPDIAAVLAEQADPQAMIDAIIASILAVHGPYRTMLPAGFVDVVKAFEADAWTATS